MRWAWVSSLASQLHSCGHCTKPPPGKTIQVISLIALLREQEQYYGPHLVMAPLSTLSNWQDEFQKWTPEIPFVLYHGTPTERQDLYKNKIMKNYQKGRPSDKFPVVCTSYEMVLRDHASLSKIDWAFIVVVCMTVFPYGSLTLTIM